MLGCCWCTFRTKANSSIVPFHRMFLLLSIAREATMEQAISTVIPNTNIEELDQIRKVSAQEKKRREKLISDIKIR